MNAMTEALVIAGVRVPSQKQRIWQWLKDNGPHSVKDLSVELKIGAQTTQAAVTDLMHRKMLEKHPRVDHKGVRLHNHYSARGRTFEMLPLPIKKGKVKAAPIAPEDSYLQPPPAKAEFNPAHLLADCTLSQMRQVHNFLGRMFK